MTLMVMEMVMMLQLGKEEGEKNKMGSRQRYKT